MSEAVRRDIIIRILTEAEMKAVDAAEKRLADFEKRVQRLNPKIRIRTGSGGASLDSEVRQVQKSAGDLARNLGKGMAEFERQTGRAVHGLREIKREVRTLASGETRTTVTSAGPLGSGIRHRQVLETGQASFTQDAGLASREQAQLALRAGAAAKRIQAEQDRIKDSTRRHHEEMGKIHENAIRDDVIRTKKGNAKIVAEAERLFEQNKKAASTMRTFGQETQQTGDTLQSAASKVLLWTAATGAIFGAVRAVRSGVGAFTDAEAATISLERVGRGFSDALAGTAQHQQEVAAGAQFVTKEILTQAVALGQSADEAQTAAVVFARLGLTQQQTAEATRVAMLAANVAGIGAAEAAQLLASAMSQFHLNVSDLPALLDKLNTLENTTRVRTEDLLQSISRGGAVFREAGGSIEEFAAITAVVAESTSRSGAEIGNAFKTIASRLADPNLQTKLFEETGIQVRTVEGDLIKIGDLMGQLVVRFQSMSKAEQAEITTQIAGIRQRNILQTSLDNFFKTQTQVIRQLTNAGSAEAENERILTQLDTKIKQLIASFERLAVVIGESGLGAALKVAVDFLTLLVNGLASMGKVGAIAVLAMTAYVASIVAASIWTARLSGSTGILAGSMTALVRGSEAVNGFLLRQGTSMIGLARATDIATAANVRHAVSQQILSTAGSGVVAQRGFVTAAGGGLGTLGAGLLQVLKGPAIVAAGIAIGAAVVKTIQLFADSGKLTADTGKETAKRFAENTQSASNEVQAAETRVRTLEAVGGILDTIAEKEANGAQVSAESARTRKQALDFLRESVQLTAKELEKLNKGTLDGADISEISKRNEQQLAESREQEIGSIETQIFQLQRMIRARKVAVDEAKNAKAGGINPFSPIDSLHNIGERFDTEAGFFQSNADFIAQAESDIRDLAKQLEAEQAKLTEKQGEKFKEIQGEIKRTIDAQKELEKLFLKESEAATKREAVVRSPFAIDDIEKIQNDLRATAKLIDIIQTRLNDPKVSPAQKEINQSELVEVRRRQQDEEAKLSAAIRQRDIERLVDENKRILEIRNEEVRLEGQFGDEKTRNLRVLQRQVELESSQLEAAQLTANISRQAGDSVRETAARKEVENLRESLRALKDRLPLEERIAELAKRREALEKAENRVLALRDPLVRLGVARQGGPEETEGIRTAVAFRDAERRTLSRLEAEKAALEAQGGGEDDQRRFDILLKEEAILEAKERLEERENQIMVERIDLATRLTEERAKQIEQTRKEIAGLSDLDLLRARITAGRIAGGSLGPVSQETFLGLDQETRRNMTQFQGLFPGANLVPNLDLGLGAEAFQKNIQGVPTIEQLTDIFQNLDILAPSELKGTIQNAALQADTVTINSNGGQNVSSGPASLNVTVNMSGMEIQADRIANLIGLEVRSQFLELVNEKVAQGRNAIGNGLGFTRGVRPA